MDAKARKRRTKPVGVRPSELIRIAGPVELRVDRRVTIRIPICCQKLVEIVKRR